MSFLENSKIKRVSDAPRSPAISKLIVAKEAADTKRKIEVRVSEKTRQEKEIAIQGFEGVSPKDRELVNLLIKTCLDYLEPIDIQDDFRDHDKRSEWVDKLGKKYGNDIRTFYRNNKLARNVIGRLAEGMLLVTQMRGTPENSAPVHYARSVHEEMRRLIHGDPSDPKSEWGHLSLARKKEISDRFAEICRTFLKKCSALEEISEQQQQAA